MIAKRKYYFDGEEIDEVEALTDEGIVKDGVSVRYPLYLEDSLDRRLTDVMGTPLSTTGRTSGYVFADTNAARCQERRDFQKAELSARYKGGLQTGDHLTLSDRNMEVIGRNPDNDKVRLADTSTLDAEAIKQEALDAYNQDITNAWRNKSVAVPI